MFVAVEISPNRNAGESREKTADSGRQGIFHRVLNILTRPKSALEEREVAGGRFGVIRTRSKRDGSLDWEAIGELADRYGDRLLLPEGLSIPEDLPLRRLRCPTFELEALVHTACHLIDRTRMPLYRRELGLVDPEGLYTGLLPRLLRHYTTVRVATDQLERYERAAAEMMETLGAPCHVGGRDADLSECALVLLPGRPSEPWALPEDRPVLATGIHFDTSSKRVISELQTAPSAEILTGCPTGIQPHQFAGALFECCGVKEQPLLAEKMVYGGKTVTIDHVTRLIQACSGFAGLI